MFEILVLGVEAYLGEGAYQSVGAYSSKFGIFVVYEPQQNGTYISSNVEEVTSWKKIANGGLDTTWSCIKPRQRK